MLTAPTLALSSYPAVGARVQRRLQAPVRPPEPAAIFGYEAMSLMLSAIERATDDGTRAAVRSQVRAAIFDTRDRRSVLGTYSIDRNGDTTLRRYGVYGIVRGQLAFLQAIDG